MNQELINRWQHQHTFNVDKRSIETRTLLVVIITFLMMIAEILVGWLTNSMALFADGWHMGTHAFALGISLIAYIVARRHSSNLRFTFGTWKVEILGAYSSSLILGIVSILMIITSTERLLNPKAIHYNQALYVAFLGLAINLICAFILNFKSGSHIHTPNDTNAHRHDRKDLNLKSAYLHVIADALTSVFAIIALFGAKYLRLNWLDPIMGILGAILIARWAIRLLKESSSILLDHERDSMLSLEIKKEVESDGNSRISDLHLLKVADEKYACIISILASNDSDVDDYKKRLSCVHELAHITVELNRYT